MLEQADMTSMGKKRTPESVWWPAPGRGSRALPQHSGRRVRASHTRVCTRVCTWVCVCEREPARRGGVRAPVQSFRTARTSAILPDRPPLHFTSEHAHTPLCFWKNGNAWAFSLRKVTHTQGAGTNGPIPAGSHGQPCPALTWSRTLRLSGLTWTGLKCASHDLTRVWETAMCGAQSSPFS